MRVRSFCFFMVILLSACGQADLEAVASGFSEEKKSFELMHAMIKEDVRVSRCFSVGTDHIGDYWEHDNKWSENSNYDRKIPLEQVLEEVGLSNERYQEYVTLFKVTGSERIELCPEIGWTRIMVHRSGLAVSGCLTTININRDSSIPKSEVKPGYSSEIRPLGNGWYLNHDCT